MLSQDTLREATQLITKSKRVLITVPENVSLDTVSTAALLARSLESLEKDVAVILPSTLPVTWKTLPLESLFKTSGIKRDLLIKIDTTEIPVGGIRYQKDEHALSIIVSPKDVSLDTKKVTLSFSPGETDCIIVLGAATLDDLGELYHKNPKLFFETPIINISISPSNDQFGEINLIDLKAVALTEIGFLFHNALIPDGEISADDATLILAGILSRTNNFLSRKVGPDTLSLVARTLSLGGDRQKILEITETIKPISLIQLFGRAVARSRFIETQNILETVITHDDFIKTNTEPDVLPRIMTLIDEHLATTRLSFLLYEDPKDRMVGILVSSRNTSTLKEVAHALRATIEGYTAWAYDRHPSLREAREVCLKAIKESQSGVLS